MIGTYCVYAWRDTYTYSDLKSMRRDQSLVVFLYLSIPSLSTYATRVHTYTSTA